MLFYIILTNCRRTADTRSIGTVKEDLFKIIDNRANNVLFCLMSTAVETGANNSFISTKRVQELGQLGLKVDAF
jgi:hypothetical protein